MRDEWEMLSIPISGDADAVHDVFVTFPPEGAAPKLELEYRGTAAEYERRRRRLIWVWDWLRWRRDGTRRY